MKAIFRLEEDISSLGNWNDFTKKLTLLVDGGFNEVIIDLQDVKKISSLALGALVASHQKMSSAGRKLVITNVGDDLGKLLEETKILSILNVE